MGTTGQALPSLTPNVTTDKEIGLNDVKQYVWSRYVENEWDTSVRYDEDRFLRIFEEHYAKASPETDPEVFYYAILIFERTFREKDPKARAEGLLRAKQMFDNYIRVTGEDDWDVVADRLEDIRAHFEKQGLSLDRIESERRETKEREETEQIRVLREAALPGMALIPAGIFLLGAGKTQVALDAFYMDQRPVTNRAYREFLEATQYRKPKYWDQEGFNRPNQPVVGVSYFDALKYAQWAGKCLPTAQQWEAAARGTDGRTYPWGETIDPGKASYDQTSPERGLCDVGSYPENVSPFGCVDMAGMVWEWTETWADEAHENKVLKGGSWADPADMLVSSYDQMATSPKEKTDILGFRCVKVI